MDTATVMTVHSIPPCFSYRSKDATRLSYSMAYVVRGEHHTWAMLVLLEMPLSSSAYTMTFRTPTSFA